MTSYYGGEVQFRFGHDRITWGVRAVILANVAVFAADLIASFLLAASGPGRMLLLEFAAFSREGFYSGFLWMPFTYMFFHSGLWHLFLNMLMLYFFGPDVERVLGSGQFLRFYGICGVLGVLANLLPIAAPNPVIGASGAVLGVLAAFVVIDPERQVFLFPLPFPINARALVIIIIVLNVIAAIGGSSGTSVATHFGGLICGYAYMKLIPIWNAWRDERRRRQERSQNPQGPSKDDLDKLGEEVDNILKFRNHDRR